MTTTRNGYIRTQAASGKNEATHATAQADRLLHFLVVNRLIGSRCRTGHTARDLMRKGLIKGIRINERVIRYSENSVLALIAGRAAEAQPELTPEQHLDRAMAKLCEDFPSKADLDLELELLAISLREDLTEDQKTCLAQEARRINATRKDVSA
jgi:hypothetical protein